MGRVQECNAAARAGRLAKARQFADAAEVVLTLAGEATDVADAFVTLAVHSGIAAADVICCARLGHMSASQKHQDAVGLLAQADQQSAKHLQVLLTMKTKAGYSYTPVSAEDRVRAERAMHALLTTANTVA